MKVIKYTLLILTLVGFIAGVAYGFGLRLYDGRIVRAGSITVELPSQPGALFFDGDREMFEPGAETVTFSNVSPGEHTLLYGGGENTLPWQRDFTLQPNEDRVFAPFVSAQNVSGFFIGTEDEEYRDVVKAFRADRPTSKETARVSADGTTAVWLAGNQVFLEWRGDEAEIPSFFCTGIGDVCNVELLFLTNESPIENVAFYKDRSDVLIVSSAEAVFAIDALINNFRNYQPLYTGSEPDFRKKDTTELYIRDRINNQAQYIIVKY